VGEYDVVIDTGPSYQTQRQEAYTNLTELASRNPQLMAMAGDLVMRSADFPMAEQLAERLEKTLPAELRDQKPGQEQQVPPEVQQQMQQQDQQIQQLSQALEAAAGHAEELEAKQDEIEVKRIEANTKAYDAITKRLQVLGPLLNPVEVQQLATETQREAMEQPDPGQPPAESMGVPEQFPELMELPPQEQQPEQPDQSGFFTPENGQEIN
jgi:hypothetical protein